MIKKMHAVIGRVHSHDELLALVQELPNGRKCLDRLGNSVIDVLEEIKCRQCRPSMQIEEKTPEPARWFGKQVTVLISVTWEEEADNMV